MFSLSLHFFHISFMRLATLVSLALLIVAKSRRSADSNYPCTSARIERVGVAALQKTMAHNSFLCSPA